MSRRPRRSEWSDWEDWDHPRPRRPADGIRAQTQRGRFGATWWAGRWLAALERLVDSGRLSRGRSYARSGQVTRLDAGPGGVDARVQGSRPTPYRVTMRFRALSEAEWDAVADAMAAQALYAARLLSGEMPEQIEEAFRAAGVTLFPADEGDLETDCTCPDWANPCKHVAAAFYLLGERFDADPFLMFELRGRTKEQIVEALRARRAGGPLGPETGAAGAAPPEPPETDAAGAAEEPVPLLPDADSGAGGPAGRPPAEAFWTAPADPDALAVTFRPPQVDALPIKLLGAPPFWQEWPEFAGAAEQAYRAIGERAERLANEGESVTGRPRPAPPDSLRGRAVGPRPPSGAAGGHAAAGGHELVVFLVRRDTVCGACDRELWRGSLLRVEGEQALCLDCADLGYLEYLPRGDPAVTRRARAHSALSAVVLEWSRTRKRYERQGLLAEPEAIRRAEQESLADAEWRARQRDRAAARRAAADEAYTAAFAEAVWALYPDCPAADAAAIAEHACERSSGRVGRTAAARALDPAAVHLAVLAHVRHVHTPYDRLLACIGDRALARARAQPAVDAVLRRWRGPDRER